VGLGTVLIADDDETIRKTVGLILTRAGYRVLEAADGDAAIRLMQDATTAAAVNLLLCDLQMPHRDGLETIGDFQQQFPLGPIVVLTGAPDFVVTDVLTKRGVTDYLLKPVHHERLLKVVGTAVRLHKLRVEQGA
jgi:DNA-binding NtrC family response regulator